MSVEVIGTVYKKQGQEGDFEWHIKSGMYEDSLFLFNDDEKRHKWKKAGRGNAVIRKYNKHALDKPRSHGIVTGKEKGYECLSDEVKKAIDDVLSKQKKLFLNIPTREFIIQHKLLTDYWEHLFFMLAMMLFYTLPKRLKNWLFYEMIIYYNFLTIF